LDRGFKRCFIHGVLESSRAPTLTGIRSHSAYQEGTVDRATEGDTMTNNLQSKSLEQLLSEADELIQRINADILEEMQEEQRIQFKAHVQNLKRIRSEVQVKVEKENSGAEGMHEAILDISKAMQSLTKYLS
jgi:hypothetical protein